MRNKELCVNCRKVTRCDGRNCTGYVDYARWNKKDIDSYPCKNCGKIDVPHEECTGFIQKKERLSRIPALNRGDIGLFRAWWKDGKETLCVVVQDPYIWVDRTQKERVTYLVRDVKSFSAHTRDCDEDKYLEKGSER